VLSETRRGVRMQFIKENLTFTGDESPMANLMLSVLGAVAQFERDLIRERQREGSTKRILSSTTYIDKKGRPALLSLLPFQGVDFYENYSFHYLRQKRLHFWLYSHHPSYLQVGGLSIKQDLQTRPREPVYDLNTARQPKFRVKSVHELSAVVYDLSAIVYCI
jgi:hypothetical protein